jgi:hypothetical protein
MVRTWLSFHILHPSSILLVYALISNLNVSFEYLAASTSEDVIMEGSEHQIFDFVPSFVPWIGCHILYH